MPLGYDDVQLLKRFSQNLGQRDLEPDHPFYVDLLAPEYDGAFGEDVVLHLGRAVSWSEIGSASFFTGFRGAGKTTQLNRLRDSLKADDYIVAKFPIERYLDVRYPLTAVQLTFAMTAGIWDACAEEGWIKDKEDPRSPFQRLLEFAKSIRPHAGDKATVKAPDWAPADFELGLRRDPTFRKQLDEFLAGRLSELAEKADSFIAELETDVKKAFLAKHHRESQGVVVIVDSLDHARSEAEFQQVRIALREIFDLQLQFVRFSRVRTVFCVPPYLRIDGTVRRIVNVKVADRRGEPFDGGYKAMKAIVSRRLPEGSAVDALVGDTDLRRLIAASGGHIRDFLRLLQEVVVRAQELPATSKVVEAAITQVRQGFLPLAEDQRVWLGAIRDSHELFLPNAEDGWQGLAELLDRHLVLLYPNEHPWYGVHPLIADELPAVPTSADQPV